MAIKIEKRGVIQLTKNKRYKKVCLGWHVDRVAGKPDYDFDVSLLMLGENGKCNHDEDFIFYNNKVGRNNCVNHTGDDRKGSSTEGYNADGEYVNDCEVINIDLDVVPVDIQSMIIVCTLYEAERRKQQFRDVKNSYVRVLSVDDPDEQYGDEEVRYNMSSDLGFENGYIVAKLIRNGRGWDFQAVGDGFDGGLEALLPKYGLVVE